MVCAYLEQKVIGGLPLLALFRESSLLCRNIAGNGSSAELRFKDTGTRQTGSVHVEKRHFGATP